MSDKLRAFLSSVRTERVRWGRYITGEVLAPTAVLNSNADGQWRRLICRPDRIQPCCGGHEGCYTMTSDIR